MTVGEKIRRVRKENGLTQKQLAEKCKMYESQIRKYELGKANPKIETIEKIAKALNISTRQLLDWDSYTETEEYKKTEIQVDAVYGIIAILKEIYGDIIEKTVSEEYGENFYYLVGKDKNKFILYEGDIDKLLKYLKSSVPFIVDEIKDTRTEQEVVAEIRANLNNPAYIKQIKNFISKQEN